MLRKRVTYEGIFFLNGMYATQARDGKAAWIGGDAESGKDSWRTTVPVSTTVCRDGPYHAGYYGSGGPVMMLKLNGYFENALNII